MHKYQLVIYIYRSNEKRVKKENNGLMRCRSDAGRPGAHAWDKLGRWSKHS